MIKDKLSLLRKRAEQRLSFSAGGGFAQPQEEVLSLLQKLNTFQIEVELQNEDPPKAQLLLDQSQRSFSDFYNFAPIGYLTSSAKGLHGGQSDGRRHALGVSRSRPLKQPIPMSKASGRPGAAKPLLP